MKRKLITAAEAARMLDVDEETLPEPDKIKAGLPMYYEDRIIKGWCIMALMDTGIESKAMEEAIEANDFKAAELAYVEMINKEMKAFEYVLAERTGELFDAIHRLEHRV